MLAAESSSVDPRIRSAMNPGSGPAIDLDEPFPGDPPTGIRPKPPAEDPSRRHRRNRDSAALLPVTAFDAEFDIDVDAPRTHWAMWGFLGIGAALLGQFAAWWLGSDGAFIGAMLFTICSLAGFIHPVFQRNAKEIWSGRLAPWVANRHLLLDLGCLFLGLTAGFACTVLAVGPVRYQEWFQDAGQVVDLRRLGWGTLDFAATGTILGNNLRVLATVLLVGVVFRYIGVLFIVVFNAAHWGAALAAVLATAVVPWWQDGLLLLTVLPHLLLEVAGYVCAGMSGIFLFRGLIRYRLRSRHFSAVGTAALELSAVGAGCIVLAALCEGAAGALLRRLIAGPTSIMP